MIRYQALKPCRAVIVDTSKWGSTFGMTGFTLSNTHDNRWSPQAQRQLFAFRAQANSEKELL
jgi:hypothetical protein